MQTLTEWDISRSAFSAYDGDRFLGIQLDWLGDGGSGAEIELHSPYGLLSRPHDPEMDADGEISQGCTVLRCYEGDRGHAWLLKDPRVEKLPLLKPGGSIVFGGALKNPSWQLVDGVNGSVQGYVPYAIVDDVPTKSMSWRFDVATSGEELIEFVHGSGMRISMYAKGKSPITIRNRTGTVCIIVDDDLVTINGNTKIQGGLDVGGGTAIPVALATPLLTYLAALEAATKAGLAGVPAAGAGLAGAFQTAMTLAPVLAAKTAVSALLAKAL